MDIRNLYMQSLRNPCTAHIKFLLFLVASISYQTQLEIATYFFHIFNV